MFLKKTKKLETQIDAYLDLVIKGGLIFKLGIRAYLDNQMESLKDT